MSSEAARGELPQPSELAENNVLVGGALTTHGVLRPLHTGGFWVLWMVLVTLTVTLSIAARFESRFPGDLRIERAVQSISVPLVGGLLNFENTIGSPWPAVIIITVITIGLLLIRHGRLALLFVTTNALRGVGSIVKGVVNRPRPDVSLVHVTDHSSGASFPSGHVFSAMLLYGALAVVVEMLPLPLVVRRCVQMLCLLVVILMGPARVYAGAHWPSDVLGGYLWGALLLLLALKVGSRWIPTLVRNLHKPVPITPLG